MISFILDCSSPSINAGLSDMASTTALPARSYPKRKRAQVSYYEASSDESDDQGDSVGIKDSRKVRWIVTRYRRQPLFSLITSPEIQNHLQSFIQQTTPKAKGLPLQFSTGGAQKHHIRTRSYRSQRHLSRLQTQGLPPHRETGSPQQHLPNQSLPWLATPPIQYSPAKTRQTLFRLIRCQHSPRPGAQPTPPQPPGLRRSSTDPLCR